jgi:hypothetical protein
MDDGRQDARGRLATHLSKVGDEWRDFTDYLRTIALSLFTRWRITIPEGEGERERDERNNIISYKSEAA